jgi:hypothetical protein
MRMPEMAPEWMFTSREGAFRGWLLRILIDEAFKAQLPAVRHDHASGEGWNAIEKG